MEFAVVVAPEFAGVVEFEPRTFRAQALSVASVSEQAAFTALPIARKIRNERGEQLLKSSHCSRFAKLQETPDFNFCCHLILNDSDDSDPTPKM